MFDILYLPWYNQNVTNREYHRNYYLKRRQEILDFLGGKCVNCGSREKLEIDHKDRKDKKYDISKRMTLRTAIDEIQKCQLLCEECHKQKTNIEISGFSHGTMYGWMKKRCFCQLCYREKRKWHENRNVQRKQARLTQQVEVSDSKPL